jgi:hypothetical protein
VDGQIVAEADLMCAIVDKPGYETAKPPAESAS